MSPPTLTHTIAHLRAYIEVAMTGKGVNLVPLLLRLDELAERDPPPSRGRQAGIDLERAIWVRDIREGLLPEVQADIATSLCRSRGARPPGADPWADLDPEFVEQRDAGIESLWVTAQLASMAACRRYAETGNVSFLRTAVVHLERVSDIARRRRPPCITVRAAELERERLGDALSAALDVAPRNFFITHVRERIGGESQADQLLSSEGWWEVPPYYDRGERNAFEPRLQEAYDDARRAEEIERAEEERRRGEFLEAHRLAAEERAQAEDASEAGVPTDDGGPVEPAASAGESDAVDGQPPQQTEVRRLVPVELPTGLTYLEPAMAKACMEELARRAAAQARRDEYQRVREEYYWQIGRPDQI